MSAGPRRNRAFPIVLLLVGLAGLGDLAMRPRMHTLRAVDAVQLVASVACLGIAVALLLAGSGERPAV